MFTCRFKQAFARICIALLFMQAAVAAYACPAFLADLEAATAAAHEDHAAATTGDCLDQHPAGSSAAKNMCHQHYAGEQSIGSGGLAFAGAAPALPLATVAMLEPAKPVSATVLAVLLQRNTAPPLSIRFQVLRI